MPNDVYRRNDPNVYLPADDEPVGSPGANRELSVARQMNRLGAIIEELDRAGQILQKRLSPVTRDAMPAASSGRDQAPRERCECGLAQVLSERCDALERFLQSITSTTDRLEV